MVIVAIQRFGGSQVVQWRCVPESAHLLRHQRLGDRNSGSVVVFVVAETRYHPILVESESAVFREWPLQAR